MENPYAIIRSRYVTEKAAVLERLQSATSNRSVARCKSPKYVFLVDIEANKPQIAAALQQIYKERNIKVTRVNTVHIHPKRKRLGRGRPGMTSAFKKAIVTLEPGDTLEDV